MIPRSGSAKAIMDAREAAWDELRAALPPGWVAGQPSYREDLRTWEQHAYRPAERALNGARRDEWTAVGQTEIQCPRELARRRWVRTVDGLIPSASATTAMETGGLGGSKADPWSPFSNPLCQSRSPA